MVAVEPNRVYGDLLSPSSYDEKRSFNSTPEPRGYQVSEDVDPVTAPTGDTCVIQQHHATALHHDLRLEMMNGEIPVLLSWTVPKGLPRRRGERHLAIRTEDHPIKYATFCGSISEADYGGGVVRIFDQGRYEIVDRNQERLTFRLDGERREKGMTMVIVDTRAVCGGASASRAGLHLTTRGNQGFRSLG